MSVARRVFHLPTANIGLHTLRVCMRGDIQFYLRFY